MVRIDAVKKITNLKWLNLFDIQYTKDDGSTGTWQMASRHALPAPGPGPILPDAVVIVPLLKVGRQRKLVVIKEFRIPIGQHEIGFPAGLIDPNESIEVCAARELFEETGFRLTKVIEVSPPLLSSAGMSNESAVMVICDCEGEISKENQESTEDIEVILLGRKDIAGFMAGCNCPISAKTWPMLNMYNKHRFP